MRALAGAALAALLLAGCTSAPVEPDAPERIYINASHFRTLRPLPQVWLDGIREDAIYIQFLWISGPGGPWPDDRGTRLWEAPAVFALLHEPRTVLVHEGAIPGVPGSIEQTDETDVPPRFSGFWMRFLCTDEQDGVFHMHLRACFVRDGAIVRSADRDVAGRSNRDDGAIVHLERPRP